MGMSLNHRIALFLRIGALCVGTCILLQGHPPASGQITTEDQQQDIQLSRLNEWRVSKDADIDRLEKANAEVITRINNIDNNVSDLQGEVKGGVGFMTALTGLAVFFQLKKKAG